ncbi:MAG: amino acid adenylation domain-containing protein [Bacillota bacterium]
MSNVGMENKVKLYPLTHPQKRIWYGEVLNKDTSLYNIGGPVRIRGYVDFGTLQQSINIFIKKNDSLRMRFNEQNGEIKQYISEFKETKIDFFDFSTCKNPEDEFNKWIEYEAGKRFDLKEDYLYYFAMFKNGEYDSGYFVKFHHLIADGWSMQILTSQICDIYMKLLHGSRIDEEVEYSYLEYIDREQKYLLSDKFIKNRNFWKQKFQTLDEVYFGKSSESIKGNRKTFRMDKDKSLKIKNFSKENKCSLNTLFVSLYLIYLYKTTQHQDLIIGVPVLNRSGKREKSIFGMFTSTMPFRMYIKGSMTAAEFINHVNSELMECYFNQKYPYDLLVQDIELKKKGYNELFNVCINYYNTRLNTEFNGALTENTEFYNGNQLYSMQIVIKEWEDLGEINLDFDYKSGDFSEEQIENMYMYLSNLIDQITADSMAVIGSLRLLPDSSRNRLIYEFNSTCVDYPKNNTIFQLFEEQVCRTPDKTAVSFNGKSITYRKLNKKANQLARLLRYKGIGRNTAVGFMTTHSIETVIGILGVIKAGGAYVPIDPCYPMERINYILEDSKVSVLLANCSLDGGLDYKVDIIDLRDETIYKGEASNPDLINEMNDLVYIIYTSGSTGKPKGTMIEHRGLVNYIWWAKKMYVRHEDDVFALYSSLSFDLTVTSVFTPLISGNKIMVYADDGEEFVLYRILGDNQTTVLKLTPAHLSLIKDLDNSNSSVKRLIVGGEDLKVVLAKSIYDSFGGDIEIFNEYGPTETVVGCMIHKYDVEKDTEQSVPVGIPADNVQIYILDKNLEPVPLGVSGEIYISGDGVARGYLNRPELTAQKFIDNPFIKDKRMYKTGDIARHLPNGIIEYSGRADFQVKIRGYRIELGEIENQILKIKGVDDVVVIDREDSLGSKYLCSYIVSKVQMPLTEIRQYLSGVLPDYMIPSRFVSLDRIPLTTNGKVNRQLLPEPLEENIDESDCVCFNNKTEEKIIKTIKEVLNVARINRRDNFYRLGGDSIKAIQIAARLNELGLKIRVKDILSKNVIEKIMACVETDTAFEALENKALEGEIGITPIVSWFFEQHFKNPNYYNQSVLLSLNTNVGLDNMEQAINILIRHHDALRINYSSQKGILYYNNDYLNEHQKLQIFDLSFVPLDEQKVKMRQICEEIKSSLDIEKGILFKACALELGHYGRRLLLTGHHLIVDGVSWRILLEDLARVLGSLEKNIELSLPQKSSSLKEWASQLLKLGQGSLKQEREYWNNVISSSFSFPVDFDLGHDNIENCNVKRFVIDADDTENLLTTANAPYGTNPNDLLLTALVAAIRKMYAADEVVIELEGHGREDLFDRLDVTRTVGWFTSIFPVKLKAVGSDLGSQIKSIKEQLRRVPNKGIGFGVLKYMSKLVPVCDKRYARFNYLGEFDNSQDENIYKISLEDSGPDSAKSNHLTCLLDINALVLDKNLNISITYSRNKYLDETVEKLMKEYKNSLASVIKHCLGKRHSVDFTPSDFETLNISQDELDQLFI